MGHKWGHLLSGAAETPRALGPPAQWEGLGCTDRTKRRTVLSAIAWGTFTLKLEKQIRQVFTRAYLSHRLLNPVKAYWAQYPPIGTRSSAGRNVLSKNAALTADAACAHRQSAAARIPSVEGPACPFLPLTEEVIGSILS
eukprot:7720011-Pyramimonas_sp.AAC.1